MKYRHILGGACCPLPNLNKSQEETIPNNVIRYTASEKLEEMSIPYPGSLSGLNTNSSAFNTPFISHEFENGIGTITFGENVTIIGSYAFYGSKITSITIPNSITSIGEWAFSDCAGLTSITIPNSVTTIGYMAFNGCNSLISITINATIPPTIIANTFANSNNCPIYVPASSVDAYKSASGWSTYADRIQAIQN